MKSIRTLFRAEASPEAARLLGETTSELRARQRIDDGRVREWILGLTERKVCR
jgi:hypothetical protein